MRTRALLLCAVLALAVCGPLPADDTPRRHSNTLNQGGGNTTTIRPSGQFRDQAPAPPPPLFGAPPSFAPPSAPPAPPSPLDILSPPPAPPSPLEAGSPNGEMQVISEQVMKKEEAEAFARMIVPPLFVELKEVGEQPDAADPGF